MSAVIIIVPRSPFSPNRHGYKYTNWSEYIRHVSIQNIKLIELYVFISTMKYFLFKVKNLSSEHKIT